MLLCDAAQVAEGKLYVLGAGWSVTGPMPVPSAIGLLLSIPWDQAARAHQLQITLLDSDGRPVLLPTPDGDQPLVIEAEVGVERPDGVPPGIALDVPFAVNLGPLPLPTGSRFYWSLEINGETGEDWVLPFSTRPADPPPAASGPADFRLPRL